MKKIITIFIVAFTMLQPFALRAQGMPGNPVIVDLLVHESWPLKYDDGCLMKQNERLFLVLYTHFSENDSVYEGGKEIPFEISRSYEVIPKSGVTAKSLTVLKKEKDGDAIPLYIENNKGVFSRTLYSWAEEPLPVSHEPVAVPFSYFTKGVPTYGFLVLMDTRVASDTADGQTFCPKVNDSGYRLGVNQYINGYRVVPVGFISRGNVGGIGPRTVDVALCDELIWEETLQKEVVPLDFYDSLVAGGRDEPMRAYRVSPRPTIAPSLPSEVAGFISPEDIRKVLAPQIREAESSVDGAFEMTLPAAAKGLMRYTVYTTTDPSKHFGEWSLLDEVLKTPTAKKVLADESGMSYTLIRVEDHSALPIVLPKIGESRFYRVVGE